MQKYMNVTVTEKTNKQTNKN